MLLFRPQMKNSINCILIGLASFDSILITTSILMFGLPGIYSHSIVYGYVLLPVLPGPAKPTLPLQPKTTAILAPSTVTYQKYTFFMLF
jgi:hypothetical protein